MTGDGSITPEGGVLAFGGRVDILGAVQDETFASHADGTILVVRGELDDLVVHELRTRVDSASEACPAGVVVELSAVDYLPSMAISVLVGCLRRAEAAGRSLGLRAAHGTIAERVLRMTGLPYDLPARTEELSEG